MKVQEVLETCLYVSSLEEAKSFYQEVLGLELHSELKERHLFFRCGSRMFLLFNATQTAQELSGVPPHGCQGAGHVAFAIKEAELEAWREHLTRSGVSIEREMRWPGGGRSIYFRDPSGNSLEFATPRTWMIEE